MGRLTARAALGIAAMLALAFAPSRARAEPSNSTLVYVGLGLAPPTYVVGVTLHEGSHALAAKLVGADVDELHLFPPGVDPHAHVFRFGWTYVHGLHTKADRIFFYLAPKITDTVFLGGFAALVFTGAWPHNRYAQLALTVGATGFWVDFTKDVFLFSHQNDVVKVFDLWCIHGWRQVPARLVYATAATGLGLIVARGYTRTFSDPPATSTPHALILPILSAPF